MRLSHFRTMALARSLVTAAALAAVTAPAAGQTTRSGPSPPGGRLVSKPEDCEALRKEWDDYKAAWTVQHQACLDGHNRGNVPWGTTCSKAPCQQLHTLVFDYAKEESERALSQCRAILDGIAKENARIAKQKAEQEAAVRRYNEQVAEYNRKLLRAITEQNASIAEQNRLAAEAVAQRNREAQAAFRELVREYQLRVDIERQNNASLQEMRQFLATAPSALSKRVSDLVDELGTVSFGATVDSLAESTSELSDVFDVTSSFSGVDPPEHVSVAAEYMEKFAALYNILKAGATNLSAGSTASQRFDDTISGLSGSTTFLFPRQPWAGGIVSEHLQGIGRWGSTMHHFFEDAFSGTIPSNDDINQGLGRSIAPGLMRLNDKIKQIEGTANQVYQWFGGGNASQ